MKLKALKKSFIIMLSIATLMVMSMAPSFAEDVTKMTSTADGTNAVVYLLKTVEMPSGTTFPGETYTFHFDTQSTGTQTDTTIDDEKVTIDSQLASATTATTTLSAAKNVLDGISFKSEGIYEYVVTETSALKNGDTYKIVDNSYVPKETKQSDKYLMTVYSAKTSDGSGCYAKEVTVQKWNDSKSSYDFKLDASSSTDSAFAFSDGFSHANVNGTTAEGLAEDAANGISESNVAFKLSCKVGDNSGFDPAKVKSGFTYDVTLGKALNGADKYYGIICTYNSDDQKYYKASGAEPIEFTAGGDAKTVTLKGGQCLIFESVTIGAKYETSAEAVSHWQHILTQITRNPKYEYKMASSDAAATFSLMSTEDPTVSTNTSGTVGDTLASQALTINEIANSVEYTEAYTSTDVTGVVTDNIPYIVIILPIIAALVLFALRLRRSEYDDEGREE